MDIGDDLRCGVGISTGRAMVQHSHALYAFGGAEFSGRSTCAIEPPGDARLVAERPHGRRGRAATVSGAPISLSVLAHAACLLVLTLTLASHTRLADMPAEGRVTMLFEPAPMAADEAAPASHDSAAARAEPSRQETPTNPPEPPSPPATTPAPTVLAPSAPAAFLPPLAPAVPSPPTPPVASAVEPALAPPPAPPMTPPLAYPLIPPLTSPQSPPLTPSHEPPLAPSRPPVHQTARAAQPAPPSVARTPSAQLHAAMNPHTAPAREPTAAAESPSLAPAEAPSSDTAPAHPAGTQSLVPPRPVAGVEANHPPAYPQIALQRREQGRVMLSVRVSADGRPLAVDVAKTSGYPILDAAALSAVRQWQFIPATQAGTPVIAIAEVPVRFRIDN